MSNYPLRDWVEALERHCPDAPPQVKLAVNLMLSCAQHLLEHGELSEQEPS